MKKYSTGKYVMVYMRASKRLSPKLSISVMPTPFLKLVNTIMIVVTALKSTHAETAVSTENLQSAFSFAIPGTS